MPNNYEFLIDTGLTIGILIYAVHLVYIRSRRKQILGKYEPGTPDYNSYRKLLSGRRLIVSLSLGALLATKATLDVRTIASSNDPDKNYILIFVPTAVILTYATAVLIAYLMFKKKDG